MVQHHTLKYHLKSLSRDQIYEIARAASIKNRSGMNREELERAVYDSIKYKNGLNTILNSLGQKSLEVVSIVLDFKGNVGYETLKRKYPDTSRSLKVNLNKALRKGALFEIYAENLGKNYIQIPKDLIKLYSGYIYRVKEKISFVDFLSKMLTKEKLIGIAHDLGLPHTGSKEELSARIGSKASPEEVLNLIDVETLKDISAKLAIPKSGKKVELINRIIENIDSMKTERYRVKRKPDVRESRPSKHKSPFYVELYEVMNKELDIRIRSKTKEKDIEDQLFQFLRARFPEHTIETQVKTSDKGKIDMAFNKDGIGIELKYKPDKSGLQRLTQQVKEYREDFNKIIVLIVADDRRIANVNIYKNKIEKIKGAKVIIYKI